MTPDELEQAMEKRKIASIALAVFALAAAIMSVKVAAAATTAPSSLSPRHLYVLDLSKAVYRFPLDQDGLPAKHPDGVLYPQGAVSPTGVTVDSVGHVFLADANPGTVSEFAAGATGHQQPISILNVSGPDYLKIDNEDRLYVHLNMNQDVAIFAKGAQGHDAPISIVPPYHKMQPFVTDYAISQRGTLYTLNNVQPVAVYDDPLNNPSQPNRLMWPDVNGGFAGTLALDEATDRLYIQFGPNGQYWNKVNYEVRPASGTSVSSFPLIFTGDCGPKYGPLVDSTVIIKKYLIVSCNSVTEVLVYRTDQFGRQRAPVEIVGQGMLSSPAEMAVGP